MNIKIKTKDIDIDFTDQCSALHEDSKKRILEVIESVMTQQLSLEQARMVQEEIGIDLEEEDCEEIKPKLSVSWDDVLDSKGGQRYPIEPTEAYTKESTDHKVNDPMWFSKATKGQMTEDFIEGYSQAVYQIRLFLSDIGSEGNKLNQEQTCREIYRYTEYVLKELNKAVASQPYLRTGSTMAEEPIINGPYTIKP